MSALRAGVDLNSSNRIHTRHNCGGSNGDRRAADRKDKSKFIHPRTAGGPNATRGKEDP